MEPNQNTNMQGVASAPTAINTSLNTPSVSADSSRSGGDVVFQGKPKKNMKMILGMVLLGILAVGGIAFGVWEMMDGKAQVAKKDEQIADLNRQLAEKSQFEVEQDDEMLVEDIVDNENVLENDKRTCDGTYYGEFTGDADMKYTYVLNKNGTFTADFGTWTTNGTFVINDNTISLTGKKETYGGPSPSFVTTDAVVAEDCSYIVLPYEGNYVFELKKQ